MSLNFFYILIYVFQPVQSKSDVHFRRPEKLKFPNDRDFPVPADEKKILNIGFTGQKPLKLYLINPENSRYPESSG